MKLYRLVLPPCLVAVLCALSGQAHASTIQDSYGYFPVNFLSGAEVNGALPGFNPAIGTLNSIAFTYDAGATLIGGNAISPNITIHDSSGTLLTTIRFPNMTDSNKQSIGSFTVPSADFLDFENAGNIDLTLQPFTACHGSANTPSGCSEFDGDVGGQVAYSYSPAGVPEPATLTLFGAGLIAISLAKRKFHRMR